MAAARRAGMRGARWSGWVRAAKIGLPLLALAMLSSVFLVASRPGPAPAALPAAQGAASGPRIGRPRFAGVTGDGDRIELRAAEARPDGAGRIAMTAVDGRLTTPARRIDMAARAARVGAEIALSGGVTVASSDGWRLRAPEVTSELARTALRAEGPVAGRGPLGRIEAGAMRVTAEALTFHDGVRVLYEPPEPAGDP